MARKAEKSVGVLEAIFAVWFTGVVIASVTLSFWKGVPFPLAVKWSALAMAGGFVLWGLARYYRTLRRWRRRGVGAKRRGREPRVGPMLRLGEKRAEELIRKHAQTLARERAYSRTLNSSGVLDEKAWRAARQRFIEDVILEALPQHVARILKSRIDVRGRWAKKIERAAKKAERKWADEGVGLDYHPGMTGSEYEAFCARLLAAVGWRAFNKGDSADQGVDLIASKDGLVVAIQCKRYRNSIGNSAVQEIVAGKALVKNVTHAAVVSNAPYTRAAKELAEANDVLLLHHNDLDMLERLVARGETLPLAA